MSEYEMEEDNYGYLTFDTPKPMDEKLDPPKFELSFVYPHDDIPLTCDAGDPAVLDTLCNEFFESCCETEDGEDGMRSLILDGKDVFKKIGRRILDSDIPFLLIFLSKNEDIVKLNLRNNELSCAGIMNILVHLADHDSITELNLQYNQLGEIGVRHFQRNQYLLKFEVFKLRGNKIGDKNSRRLGLALAKNKVLKKFDVSEMDQNETSLTYFITSLRNTRKPHNKTLEILNLSRPNAAYLFSKFNSLHAAEIIGSMLRYNAIVEELYLQKFNFYCHDIEAMVLNGKHNKTLKMLDLSCNNIGDHGAEFLAEWLKSESPLQYLLLGKNIISNIGIKTLSRAIPSSDLLMLDVSYNRFNDEGGLELFHSFQKYPRINHIRVFGNEIGHETAKVVERLLCRRVFLQQNIDVKIYEVDGVLQFAYQKPVSWKYVPKNEELIFVAYMIYFKVIILSTMIYSIRAMKD